VSAVDVVVNLGVCNLQNNREQGCKGCDNKLTTEKCGRLSFSMCNQGSGTPHIIHAVIPQYRPEVEPYP
jgi:hypothetical protein